MKINIRILSLGCLAAFALLFAASTPAQKFRVPGHAPSQKSADDASPAGRSQAGSDTVRPDIPICTYQFTSGSGQTYLQFCVTVNGNIIEFQSPAGVEQIAQGPPNEGYGICDSFTVGYYDYAAGGASTNWNTPTLVSKSATMVKIERTTSDGLWTLTQTISSGSGTNPFAKIVMALKNNSASTKTLYLYRYALALPENASSSGVYTENYDGTQDSAWGYQAYGTEAPYGLMIQNVGTPSPESDLGDIEGFARDVAAGPPNPCQVTSSTTIYNGVGSIMYFYSFTLEKGKTATVTDRYISF